MFNSLKYAKQLIKAGFTQTQAEAQMQIMTDLLETKLVMKQDLKDLEVAIQAEFKDVRGEMGQLRADMNHKFDRLDHRITSGNTQLEQRMTIKLGSLAIAAVGILYALLKFSAV